MKAAWHYFLQTAYRLFSSRIKTTQQWALILVVAGAFVLMPVDHTLNDWSLNTAGLWDQPLQIYDNPDSVYPPWGLILLLPFYWMRIAGARFFSVLTIALLAKQRNWSVFTFFLIVLSPYFVFTMLLVNMDILVLVFPLWLWQFVENKRWRWLGRGLALSILLLKPQAGLLLWLYLLWQQRKNWRSLLVPLLINALIVVPISLLGSPPLLLQWLNNIANPSPQNQLFWAINNVSLSNHASPLVALLVVLLIGLGLSLFMRKKHLAPDENIRISALLMAAMLLSPYASQQSVSAALAFVPSLPLLVVQIVITLLMGLLPAGSLPHESIRVAFIFVCGLVFYALSALATRDKHGQNEADRGGSLTTSNLA